MDGTILNESSQEGGGGIITVLSDPRRGTFWEWNEGVIRRGGGRQRFTGAKVWGGGGGVSWTPSLDPKGGGIPGVPPLLLELFGCPTTLHGESPHRIVDSKDDAVPEGQAVGLEGRQARAVHEGALGRPGREMAPLEKWGINHRLLRFYYY